MSSKQWSKIVIKKDQNYVEACRNVQKQFQKTRVSSDSPIEMALFSREDSRKEDTFYFSPACSHYARNFLSNYAAVLCEPPDLIGLILLEGDASSKSAIFGEDAVKKNSLI